MSLSSPPRGNKVPHQPSQLASLPVEVLWRIRLQMSVRSALALSASNREYREFIYADETGWRLHFQHRWGAQYQLDESTKLGARPSWSIRRLLPLFAILENGFCGADVQLRGEIRQRIVDAKPDSIKGLVAPRKAVVPPWLLACALCDVTDGEGVLRCKVCNELDIFTRDMNAHEELPTQVKSWVRPCACRTVAHRSCLERDVPLHWCNMDDGTHTDVDQTMSVGYCKKCGVHYRAGYRLPYGLTEVMRTAIRDPNFWDRFLNCAMHWGALVILTAALEGATTYNIHGRVFGLAWPEPGGVALAWWLWQQLVLLHVMYSSRFVRIVERLWHNPEMYSFYVKFYCYFVAASTGIVLTSTPLVDRYSGIRVWPELRAWLTFLGTVNMWVYFGVALMSTYVFLKTNYAFLTVVDYEQDGEETPRRRNEDHPLLDTMAQWQPRMPPRA